MSLQRTWVDGGREPQCAPDPAYPEGKHLDISDGARLSCITGLDWPAPRCGYWLVECKECDLSVMVTTAGRPDDPRSIRLACKVKAHALDGRVVPFRRR
jgi:hypothetical protein